MLKTILAGCGVALFGALTVLPVQAQVVATLALRDGQRPSGELVDLNASGFTLRVNGQSRQVSMNDVAAVEFVVAAPPAEAKARIDAGQPVVVLRNGQIIEGRLYDIGGTRPLRVTIDTPSGRRDFTSNDVAQIYMHAPKQAADLAQAAAPSGAIIVAGNQPWTSTGMTVARGEHIKFLATGDIMIAEGASSGIGGSSAVTNTSARYPVPSAAVGALIARVGNGTPFAIGANTDFITMPAAGELFLGVNDDHVADNTGSYTRGADAVERRRKRGLDGSWKALNMNTTGLSVAASVVVFALVVASCSAQPDVDAVAIGDDVAVTRADGGVVEGTVTSRDDASVQVTTGTTTKSIPKSEIVDVQVVDAARPTALPPVATFREYTVPEGAKLLLVLTTSVNSGTSKVEDRVEATLAEAVSVGNVDVLPAGSIVTGTVSAVEGSGKVKGLASITLHFTSVAVAGRPDHDVIDAHYSETAAATRGEDATKIGIGAGAGAVIGGLLGGQSGAVKGAVIGGGAGTAVVLATTGDEVEHRAGARLTVVLKRSVDVRVPIT